MRANTLTGAREYAKMSFVTQGGYARDLFGKELGMEKRKPLSPTQIALLFGVVYCASYVTRINFAAVIQEVVTATGFLKTQLSVIPVCLFVTYGVGQIINGFLGDKIKPQFVILFGLAVATAINFVFPFCSASIPAMCVLWGVNGFAQAMLWPPMVKILVRTTSGPLYNRCMVWVSWGSSMGTILVYLVSPLLISLFNWQSVFFACSAFGLAATLLFFFLQGRVDTSDPERENAETGREIPQFEEEEKFRFPRAAVFPVLFIGFAIMLQGMLRDGTTTWMPTYLVDAFGFGNEYSILLTVLLAVFAMIVIPVLTVIYRRFFENEVAFAVLIYGAAVMAAVLLFFFWQNAAVLSIILFMILNVCAHGLNLMLVTHVPKRFRRYGSISTVSGCINACTYVGSAIATYGIAKLVDTKGWPFTIGSWAVIAGVGGIACLAAVFPWKKFIAGPEEVSIVDAPAEKIEPPAGKRNAP